MTDTYEDLIRQLRDALWSDAGAELLFTKAADAIEALVKERDDGKGRIAEWIEASVKQQKHAKNGYQRGVRDGERIGLEKAAKLIDDNCIMSSGTVDNPVLRARRYGDQHGREYATAIRALITQEQSDDDKV